MVDVSADSGGRESLIRLEHRQVEKKMNNKIPFEAKKNSFSHWMKLGRRWKTTVHPKMMRWMMITRKNH